MLTNSQKNETFSDSEIHSDAICLPNADASIAELAYYKSENRGFEPVCRVFFPGRLTTA